MPNSARSSFLDRLPPEALDRLRPYLQLIWLELDRVVYAAGNAVTQVYFPVTAVIDEVLPVMGESPQLLRRVDSHTMAGSCVLGHPLTTRTASVTRAGQAYCMQYDDFARALNEIPVFREVVMQDAARACLPGLAASP